MNADTKNIPSSVLVPGNPAWAWRRDPLEPGHSFLDCLHSVATSWPLGATQNI